MEDAWENWHLHMEMDHHDNNDFLDNNCNHPGGVDDDDDDFLRDILLQQPSFSSESETDHHHHDAAAAAAANSTVGSEIAPPDQTAGNMVKSNSSNSIVSQQYGGNNNNNNNNNDNNFNNSKISNNNDCNKRPRRSSSPRTYILSFDNSTMTPATPEQEPCHRLLKGSEGISRSPPPPAPPLPSNSKRSMAGPRLARDHDSNGGGAKKSRNSAQTMDHIMAERKRRQELTERFIALSATIPGLSKTDKASILRAAIDYVKQLQERVQELEKQDKKRNVESVILVRKSDTCANNNVNNEDTTTTTTSSETSCDHDNCGTTLPEVEARVMGKEVLIEIHCEKENGIEIKILDQLENVNLCVTGSSVLPFGNSALGITIIAQMDEAYKMTVNDLVKNLRQVLLKSPMALNLEQ